MMVFGPSSSGAISSLLNTRDLKIGLAAMALVSTGFVTVLGSWLAAAFGGRAGLGCRFGDGAGLGCRFGNGLVSALLPGLLPSLVGLFFSEVDGGRSWMDGALSVFTSGTLGSGVTALGSMDSGGR